MNKNLRVFVPAAFILLLLAVVAVPSFLHARKTSRRNACLNNLRMLTCPMTCCVPLSERLSDGDKMDPKIVCQYIKGNTMPVCPEKGTYNVAWIVGGPTPKCSYHGDLLLDVDHFKNLKGMEDEEKRTRPVQNRGSAASAPTNTVPIEKPPLIIETDFVETEAMPTGR